MLNKINIDYIGVVRKEDDNYIYEEREITTNKKLINKLQAIAEDDTMSILDMQVCMHEAFGGAPKPVHRVVLPENYDTPFVFPSKYPDFISEEHYENECQKVAESVHEEDAPEELKKHNHERKEEFITTALRYIYATQPLRMQRQNLPRTSALSSTRTMGLVGRGGSIRQVRI